MGRILVSVFIFLKSQEYELEEVGYAGKEEE